MTVEIGWERKLVTRALGCKNDHTAAVNKHYDVPTHMNARLAFVEGSSVRMYEHRCE